MRLDLSMTECEPGAPMARKTEEFDTPQEDTFLHEEYIIYNIYFVYILYTFIYMYSFRIYV